MRATSALIALCVCSACHPSGGAHGPAAQGPADEAPGVADIVVHDLEDVDGWELRAARILHFGNGGRGGSLDLPSFEGRREQDRVLVECSLYSVCAVGLRRADGVAVGFDIVTGAPRVDVQLPDLPEVGHEVRPLYLEPDSRSARLTALLEEELALVHACRATTTGKCGGARLLPDPQRVVPGHDPQEAVARLRALLTAEDEALATWAYFNAGCPESPMDAEFARLALREPIDPLGRNVWPMGVARAILAAEGRSGAQSRLEAMRAPADRELAAATLLELLHDSRRRGELDRAVMLHDALRTGEGPWKGSPLNVLFAQRSVIGAAVGSIPLRTLTGERRDPADMIGSPVLLYTAASWCAACHRDGLPELRSLVADHPDLAVLYILWDDAESAATYVATHAPIPGTVVMAGDAAQSKLAVLLGAPAFPSFLVIDGQGRVAALPSEGDSLDAVVRRSGVLTDG